MFGAIFEIGIAIVMIVIVGSWVYSAMALAADCGDMPTYENVKHCLIKDEYQEDFTRWDWFKLILGGY